MVNLEILLECFKHFYYYYFGDGRRSFEYFVSDGFIALIPSKCFLFYLLKHKSDKISSGVGIIRGEKWRRKLNVEEVECFTQMFVFFYNLCPCM